MYNNNFYILFKNITTKKPRYIGAFLIISILIIQITDDHFYFLYFAKTISIVLHEF